MLLIDEAKELVSYKLEDYKNDASLFLRLDRLYRSLNRSTLCCLDQVESALIQLSNHITKAESLTKPKKMPNKFVLKEDSLLYSDRLHQYYTPDTITDEVAIEFLASNKVYANFFDSLPEGWEKLVDEYGSQAPKKRKKTAEVTELVPEVAEEVEENSNEEGTTQVKTTTSTKKKIKK